MISKEDLKDLMMSMVEFLKKTGVTDEEILGTFEVVKMDAIQRGVYKDNLHSEGDEQ